MKEFIDSSVKTLTNIYKQLEAIESIDRKTLGNNAALMVVDMNNGFASEGALFSERIEKLKAPIGNLAKTFDNKEMPIIIINDYHEDDCLEFSIYPKHCIKDTKESDIIDELKNLNNKLIFNKNSTNGFINDDIHKKIVSMQKEGMDKLILVGDCTDICLYQMATTIKSYFNERNIEIEIIVPMNLVDTFNLEATNHNADLMNVMFLYSMIGNGINVVRDITI